MFQRTSNKPAFVDSTKVGEYSAPQPLSGVDSVSASMMAVNGTGNGGYVQVKSPEKIKASDN